MQGFERMDRQLADVGALAGHLVPAGSMFAFLAGHRAEVFPDEDYADLFAPPGKGRPSVPATQMAAVLTLQALHGFSDRETAEAVRFDVRWKAAIGAALDDPGFDSSTLVYWRRRLAASARPHRVNDAVRKVIEETGVLRGRRRRAVDSTILDDAVATQDTVTQLVSAIRRTAREVPGAAAVIAAECTGHDYSRPGKPQADWDDPAAKDALVSALVNDANAVVAAFAGTDLDETAATALALLALVAGQDVEPAEGSDGRDGRWRIARKVAEDRVISAVDPGTRHTRKSAHARRDGYRAHVAADPETGIITDEKLTRACGEENADPAVAAGFAAAEAARHGPARRPARAVTARTARWPGTATRPTEPGNCAMRSAAPGTRRSSSPSRSSPRCPAGSPSMTSPSMSRPARSPARPASPARSRPPATPSSAPPARPARCAPGAPPPSPGGPSASTSMTPCSVPPARTGPACARTTRRTGRTSSVSSPRSLPGADSASSSATAASPRTTPGSSEGPPPSTSATSSAAASPAATAPGLSLPDQQQAGTRPCPGPTEGRPDSLPGTTPDPPRPARQAAHRHASASRTATASARPDPT